VVALAAAMALTAAVWLVRVPTSDPDAIALRIRVLGPRFVYGRLACCGPDFQRWDEVVHGVRSGDGRWLAVASGLRPAIDGHPSEELHDAVVDAFDANPAAAVALLVPTYTADVVCGGHGTEVEVGRQRAQARLQALAHVEGPSAEMCRAVLEQDRQQR
jgi:hypothetical protein